MTQTVPDQQVTDEVPSRDEVFTSLMHGLMANLPAPKGIAFRGDAVSIDLDGIAELNLWREWFGMQDREVRNQPHPSLSDPADMEIWLANTWARWRGWHLALAANDPITGAQRDGWVSSGKAAEFAKYNAEKAAAEAGQFYSREPDEADDPTPVSPARVGAPHVVAVTNGGMVDETEPVCTPDCDALQSDPAKITGLDRSWHADNCPVPVGRMHLLIVGGTMCGLTKGTARASDGGTASHDLVDCKACIDEMPF